MLVSIFRLGDIYLGINIVLIREINRSSNCTPVPGSRDYIRGMLNIRGRVITLFDWFTFTLSFCSRYRLILSNTRSPARFDLTKIARSSA